MVGLISLNVYDFTKAGFQFTKKERSFSCITFPKTIKLFYKVEIDF